MSKKTDPYEMVPRVRELLSDGINADMQDHDVARFVVARSHNLQKVVDMIQKWHAWYNTPFTDFNVAEENRSLRPRDILTHNPDNKQEQWGQVYPCVNIGIDKQGRPIYWEKSGVVASTWSSKVRKEFTEDELYLRHLSQQYIMIQRLAECSAQANTHISKQVLVMDMKGLPFAPEWNLMKTLKRIIDVDQDYYPEMLGTILLINAPLHFTVVWAVVKPWLDPLTLQKVQIVGSNYLPTLREFIDDSQIPTEYGGSLADVDWTCSENIPRN